ncbi:filamentous hemagglutinin N-terminal domain-containing protein [Erwinia sp. ErVv1]|uniref:filamentous hemagglutinin N-terminal domain-containing protein n=1 Tax=Erwinia sp. ErVv1 TaxID=1603299 RepID=UPI0008367875|nr:filamentous hemagglutinin N-terminal domain-containing protein [Erwinia sp. ErVv1]
MKYMNNSMRLKKASLLIALSLGCAAFSVGAVPVIDINAPVKGISHNIYSEFNVGQEGIVFNNSMSDTNSQLAGKISANNNLLNNIFTNGPASVIIAEVSAKSGAPSQLNGLMEVAGKKADLIIANPAGINCNGCGSINTNRLSLVAGKTIPDAFNTSIFGSSDIYFQITEGNVIIDKGGLKSGKTDYTDIIARAVKVNGEIQAKDLAILTGEMNVARKKGRSDAIYNSVSTSAARPSYALDVSTLGSMYADRISMVGSEKGVGVRNAGGIATKGTLSLDASGRITNEKAGKLSSDASMMIASAEGIINRGKMRAHDNLLEAKSVENAAGGTISSTSTTLIRADSYTNSGKADVGGLYAQIGSTGRISMLK